MKRKKSDLIITAHPDDETLFFSGLIQSRPRQRPWEVICVTDGNADGMGRRRHRQFLRACKELGVANAHWWKYPDLYEKRLDVVSLIQKLKQVLTPHRVFTHNILGEYGHPHHQDVSLAVHRAFFSKVPVFSSAYNAFPSLRIHLTEESYQKKARILSTIYASETRRFAHLLPATSSEGFVQVDLKEVEALYSFFCFGKKPNLSDLNVFRWYWSYMKDGSLGQMQRPF
ncbi:MAG: PIG-L family deacetylase [Bdellovibrionales bacterium]|nr:PIG-L family deacetylase [Bdellovibrionales bacterium]